jgi:hypothetical protein
MLPRNDSLFPWLEQRLPRRAIPAFAALLFAYVAGSYFWNIGVGEFFAWDESLYAWRAKVALVEGAWLDQVDWAEDNFYSGAFPRS